MKFTQKILALVLAAAMLFSFGISASAAGYSDKWAVGWADTDYKDYLGWVGNKSSAFSVDSSVHTDSSRYSIKIQNKDYNTAYVEKTFQVKPFTTYRFSAMVKYSGYALDPKAEVKSSGACIGKAYSYENSGYTTNKGWKQLEFFFTTGKETTYNLCLQNGIYNGNCKGTAWFSDVRLEKAELTTNWEILAVVFRNIDATAKNSVGKTLKNKATLSADDEKSIKRALNNLKTSLPELSGKKIGVKNIRYVVIDETITKNELAPYIYKGDNYFNDLTIDGFRLDETSPKVKKILDKLYSEKKYDQAFLFVPLDQLSGGFRGLGGSIAQFNCYSDVLNDFKNDAFPDRTIVHELCHILAYKSELLTGKEVSHLHYASDYGYKYNSKEWFSAYLQSTIPGGLGVDPLAFKVPSGKYSLVSDDMTTGMGIESNIVQTDISKLKVAEIKNCTYNGKARVPTVKITDGKYTLKKGTDYTISCSNNKSVGVAQAVIKGKGSYKGQLKIKFSIVPKAPAVKVTKSKDKLTVSWNKVSGAKTYYLWVSKNGGKYEQIAKLESDQLSKTIKYSSKNKYTFAVSAYVPKAEAYTEYGYSNEV